MPQRLRQLSQDWANLAVRGFDKSAQAEIDKNNRDRDNLNAIGNTIGSAIVRKKGRERQDKLLADDRAREDAIRKERYGREDARHAIEDGRYDENKQTQRDILALNLVDGEMGRVTDTIRNTGGDPASQRAAMSRYEELQATHAMLTGRLMAPTQRLGSPGGENAALKEPYASSPRPVPTGGDPNRTPYALTPPTVGGGMVGGEGGPRRSETLATPPPASLPPSVLPPAATPAPTTTQDPTLLTPSGQKAVEKSKEAARLKVQHETLMRSVSELDRRIANAKSPAGVPEMHVRKKALIDAANRAQVDAAAAEQTAQLLEARGREEVQAQAKMGQQRAAIVEVMNQAKAWGERAIGGFAKAWTSGVRDPKTLEAFAVGAMKEKEAEAALAAKTLTPAQEEANAARKGQLSGIEAKAKEAANPGAAKDDSDKVSKSALAKYARQTTDYGYGVKPVRWETFDTDELHAVMLDPGVDLPVRVEFRKAWEERQIGVDESAPSAPAAPAPTASPAARSAASAELKALPPAQQTPEAWKAIKRKHGL